ncbi:ferritin [Pseudonocardiaceae bacterium YIM PH 21723]|nr:ferritin [Pseudonocardiaceae bacterium YIM PH 21723]
MTADTTRSQFETLLREQVRNEFTASQQYIALAVWFDDQDLPQLASHFYKQALEERNHAMMMVQFLLDNDLRVSIPGVPDVHNDFKSVREGVELALQQEKTVTDDITTLAKTARAEGNYLGEQFMQWFLKEQVEEVSAMATLLAIVERAEQSGNLFHVEDFLARETVGDQGTDPTAPATAGGAL